MIHSHQQATLSRGDRSDGLVPEDHFRLIRDWGFDFARLPMDCWLWIDSDWPRTRKLAVDDVYKIKESALEQVDRIVELGDKFGLHVSLNFHRAPGYCINDPEREPFVLWTDKRAEDVKAEKGGEETGRAEISGLTLVFAGLAPAGRQTGRLHARPTARSAVPHSTQLIQTQHGSPSTGQ